MVDHNCRYLIDDLRIKKKRKTINERTGQQQMEWKLNLY